MFDFPNFFSFFMGGAKHSADRQADHEDPVELDEVDSVFAASASNLNNSDSFQPESVEWVSFDGSEADQGVDIVGLPEYNISRETIDTSPAEIFPPELTVEPDCDLTPTLQAGNGGETIDTSPTEIILPELIVEPDCDLTLAPEISGCEIPPIALPFEMLAGPVVEEWVVEINEGWDEDVAESELDIFA